ncbi:MAG: adenosine deaminase family protein [Opitutales bacterium]|nr:adenosine deaminase family protein [Opitutales bacterium]
METARQNLARFLAALPKTETHLHIEGALPWELLKAASGDRFPCPPASWAEDFRFSDFAHFETELLEMAFAYFTSPERYHEAASAVFRKLRDDENVRYVETSFASGMIEFGKLDARAVAQAIRGAAPEDMEVRVFMGIHHNGYNDATRDFIEASLEWPELAGIDLHGTESFPLEPWTADLWARARAAGKFTKAHAGEFCGPDFVARVIDELGVNRIQHGVRAAEDTALLDRMARDGIACDVCPLSNVKLGVVPTMADHPLPRMLRAGVVCTVSTDDPISFGNRLSGEYLALAQVHGLGPAELAEVAANGFRVALLPEPCRRAFIDEIARLAKEHAA